jgi:MFS transporter, PPP family, 3-phenylpropionic acid transporter
MDGAASKAPPRDALSPASLAARVSLFYGASFLVNGIYGPYFGVWLTAEGLTPTMIGVVLSLPMFVRMVAGPLFAFAADRWSRHRLVVQLLVVTSLIGFLAPNVLGASAGIVLIAAFNALAMPSIVPIGESFAVAGVQRFGLDYGRMRMWGSILFVVANLAGGVVIANFGAPSILWMLTMASVATLGVTLLLPATLAGGGMARMQFNEIGGLLAQPRFVQLLAACGAIQCSHGFFNTFATLAWRDQGISPAVIGLLWATAVISEVILFAFARRPLSRLGGSGMIVLGASAALFRWIAYGFDLPLPLLFAFQALHGLTYGATHIGAMHEMAQQIPMKLSATAQGLYAATTGGIFTGAIVLACGPLYAHFGAGTYWVMALVAALGLALALRFRRN